MQKNQNTIEYSITEQGMFPALFLENLDVLDPVFVIDDLFLKEDMTKYLKKSEYKCGRKRYNSIDLLKTVLFGFMDEGYITLRGLEENCKVNIRYMHLMHYQTPSYKTFGNFINESFRIERRYFWIKDRRIIHIYKENLFILIGSNSLLHIKRMIDILHRSCFIDDSRGSGP